MHSTWSIAFHSRLRAAALLAAVALALAGCDGVGPGLPSDCPPGDDCNGPVTPVPIVRPTAVTAQVGTSVTLSAVAPNVPATGLTWQWYRSSDGGAHYDVVPGATGADLTLAGVSLADDGATFQVIARANGLGGSASSRLAVTASAGLVFADGEFQATDWVGAALLDGSATPLTSTEELVATGGHPGAWRRMVFQLAPQAVTGTVGYTSLAGGYAPQAQGAVYVIDYSEDGLSLETSSTRTERSALLLDQAGRRYMAAPADSYARLGMAWDVGQDTPSLRAQDFILLDGPACQAGESCPDFTAAGASMRFGFWRTVTGAAGATVSHGIDNWKVTVWPR